jgi:hypothetical protein
LIEEEISEVPTLVAEEKKVISEAGAGQGFPSAIATNISNSF